MSIPGTPDSLESTDIKSIAEKVAKLFRRFDVDYNQSKRIIAEVRELNGLAAPKGGTQTPELLTGQEQFNLIHAAYARGGKDGLLLNTLFTGGFRVEEFTEIEVGHLDVSRCTVQILDGKNGKSRTVPLPHELVQKLAVYLEARRKDYIRAYRINESKIKQPTYLFETVRKSKYTPRRVQQIVKEVAISAGIEKRVFPHLMRRMVAVILFELGMSKEDLQQFLGHENIQTTEHYLKGAVKEIQGSYNHAMSQFFMQRGRIISELKDEPQVIQGLMTPESSAMGVVAKELADNDLAITNTLSDNSKPR